MSKQNKNYELTPEVRVNWPNLFEAKAFKESDTPKYSVQAIFDKKYIPFFKKLVDAAIFKKYGSKPPKKLRLPFNDGNETDNAAYENKIYINVKANADASPWVVDRYKNKIMDRAEVYSGCYAYICLWPYVWENSFGKGVSFQLYGVMKTRDGERLSPAPNADEALADVEVADDSENPDSYQTNDEDLPDYMK